MTATQDEQRKESDMKNLALQKRELELNQRKQDFPALQQLIHGKPLVYLDSAASSQKPQVVLDALARYYSESHANVHRGVHTLSERATLAYEKTREHVRQFINAAQVQEIIFVSGATEAINVVARSYGDQFFQQEDEILLSMMEHHSNIVPWQQLCERTGARLRVIPLTAQGEIDQSAYPQLLTSRTKLLAITHASNVLGTINPIKEMTALAHAKNIPVLVDGAQAFGHLLLDVRDLDCDFYVLSSHKAYGPTGVGVLYGKKALLDKMPPYKGGGGMIETVSFDKTTYASLPYKFEAGTPNIADVVGFQAALEYLHEVGIGNIYEHEQNVLAYALEKLSVIPGLDLLGNAAHRLGVISFELENIHPHDLGTILDQEGIAIRVGHHCAMPLMEHLGVPATARASIGLYNTRADIDALVEGIHRAKRFFK